MYDSSLEIAFEKQKRVGPTDQIGGESELPVIGSQIGSLGTAPVFGCTGF